MNTDPTLAAAATRARDSTLRSDLRRVAERRIFFGHQSVGMNLLDGLRDLATREGVALRIVDACPMGVEPGTIAHAFLGENGAPMKKLADFARALAGGAAAGADLALVKLCYVDVRADTDVDALFAAYRNAISEGQAASPGTTIVHVTTPLQTMEGGARALAKQVLRRPLRGTSHNAKREALNELVRREYVGKAPLFDLARIEATRPDGTVETSAWQGRRVRALVRAYSDDGGHLNVEGRRRAAAELAAVLAAAR